VLLEVTYLLSRVSTVRTAGQSERQGAVVVGRPVSIVIATVADLLPNEALVRRVERSFFAALVVAVVDLSVAVIVALVEDLLARARPVGSGNLARCSEDR
jgi:hypothetical protein